jgi:5'-phosphate synthase pdxT subunit
VTAPRVGVLALQGDVSEHLRALEDAGATGCRVRTSRELATVDALVLPGGESTTIIKLIGIFDLLEPLRARMAERLPVYGSCAGMILLATDLVDAADDQPTLGGIDMTVRRNAFGRQVDSFEAKVDVAGLRGGPIQAVFIRAPRVDRVGDTVDVLGRIDSGANAGSIVAVRQGNLLATSFHPELTGDLRVHSLFVDIVKGN